LACAAADRILIGPATRDLIERGLRNLGHLLLGPVCTPIVSGLGAPESASICTCASFLLGLVQRCVGLPQTPA